MDAGTRTLLCFAGTLLGCLTAVHAESAPVISLDEFMNATDVQDVKLSPDGSAAVIVTVSPDWQHNRFGSDLWIWREKTGKTVPLTRSGHAREPQWSPDGKYIAFLSDSALADDAEKDKDSTQGPERVWVIAAESGESFPWYQEKLEAHAFAWSSDGSRIFFSCPLPLTKAADDAHKEEWKDVVQWREQERGDLLLALPVAATIAALEKNPSPHAPSISDDPLPLPALASRIAVSEDEIAEIAADDTEGRVAFVTDAVSNRLEDPKHNELYLVGSNGGPVRRLTENQARESELRWSKGRLYFLVAADEGALEGKFQSTQGRLYVIDPASGKVDRLGRAFEGSWKDFTVMADGRLIATGLKGTQSQLYRVEGAQIVALPGVAGTYATVDAGLHSQGFVVKHSTVAEPTQVFLVADADQPSQAKAISNFNILFTQRAQPQWTTYQWKTDDGVTVEGMLLYPPNAMGKKQLRMLTLIHGGPADADGNYFGADWYDWASLAAAHGWLVFRPNYRGSSGYGDKFMLDIAPHLVSRPGKDILEGVDALVKDGIADPEHLTIGGYSYGGYMTNWLITQTNEFKAAVTGAGAVEHAANWGNDDTSYDDMWYLGDKLPWQDPAIYQSEAALFQMDKVKTPTHIVGGDADVRVSYLEDVLMERALQQLQVPHRLLVFPGEGHSLDTNPWHGYIKVREELLWLDKYGRDNQERTPTK